MTYETKLWDISLLGSFQAKRTDQAVILNRFRTRKTASLLAFLALNMQAAHSRDKLIELLWPASTPKSGRNSLRVSLNALRRQLEPDDSLKGQVILSQGQTLQLNRDRVQTDVQRFEQTLEIAKQTSELPQQIQQFKQAIAHYGGELLPGDPSAWVEQEALRLADLYLCALYQLGEDLLEIGALTQALTYVHQSIQLDPFCDACHFLLMQLHVGLNRPARAIQQYQQLAQLWQAEFESPPPAYIQTWAEKLINQTGNSKILETT